MYGNRILYRIATDHQADERRIAGEARRATTVDGEVHEHRREAAGRSGRRPISRRLHLPRLRWLRRGFGAPGA